MPLEMRRRTHLLRKTRNKFFEVSNYRKDIFYFVNISAQTNDRILIFFFIRSDVKNSTKTCMKAPLKNGSQARYAEIA